MPPRRLVPGELGATDRAAAVGIGSLSAARFFDFLGCGPRPEGDGMNGANLQGPAASSSGGAGGGDFFLRCVAVAVVFGFFVAVCFVARPEDADLFAVPILSKTVSCKRCFLDLYC